jgi:hypothetical protein
MWCLSMALTIVYHSKKDGSVQWITDFRKLNEQILRKVYHLPKIQDILT